MTGDGRTVYVGIRQAPGAVDVIDTASLTNVKSVATKGEIHNVYVTPDSKYAVAGSIAAAVFVWLHRWPLVVTCVMVPFLMEAVIPRIIHALYVRPNEISIQKPYIQRHIAATRAAFGLERNSREIDYKARMEARIDPVKNKPLLDNVRLWDWRAFHDTVTQIQALRPYYVFADTDVDRYNIDGDLRQVMLTPRELDVLTAVAAGLTNRQIAERLTIGEATAKTHISNLLSKLACHDRAQLVVLAYESGVVRPGHIAR